MNPEFDLIPDSLNELLKDGLTQQFPFYIPAIKDATFNRILTEDYCPNHLTRQYGRVRDSHPLIEEHIENDPSKLPYRDLVLSNATMTLREFLYKEALYRHINHNIDQHCPHSGIEIKRVNFPVAGANTSEIAVSITTTGKDTLYLEYSYLASDRHSVSPLTTEANGFYPIGISKSHIVFTMAGAENQGFIYQCTGVCTGDATSDNSYSGNRVYMDTVGESDHEGKNNHYGIGRLTTEYRLYIETKGINPTCIAPSDPPTHISNFISQKNICRYDMAAKLPGTYTVEHLREKEFPQVWKNLFYRILVGTNLVKYGLRGIDGKAIPGLFQDSWHISKPVIDETSIEFDLNPANPKKQSYRLTLEQEQIFSNATNVGFEPLPKELLQIPDTVPVYRGACPQQTIYGDGEFALVYNNGENNEEYQIKDVTPTSGEKQ